MKVIVTLARVILMRKSFTSVSKEQFEERETELRHLFEEFCSVLLYGKWGKRTGGDIWRETWGQQKIHIKSKIV